MKTRLFAVIFFGLILFGASLPAAAAPPADNIDVAVEIIVRINTYRQELGLPPYTYDSTLMAVAQAHTEYQASIEVSTHKGEGDTTSSQRAAAGGYAGGEFAWVNEMIYHGQYATPEKAVEWWKGSPIHNEIMTSDLYHQIGVGVAETETYIYYTVNVGSIPGVTSAGTAGVLGPDVNQVRADMAGTVDEPPPAEPTAEVASQTDTPVDEAPETGGEAEPAPGTENSAGNDVAVENNATAGEQPAAARQTNWGLIVGGGLLALVVFGAVVIFGLRGRVSEEEMEELLEEEYSDFFDLPREEQFNRLQVAARQALEAYPLEVVGVEPLRYVLNAEFLVTAYHEAGDGEEGQFVVRVNAPGFHRAAEIRSELEWLAALNQDTDLKVPNPLPTRRGEWVETVEMDLLDGPRHCVVFEYIPGHTIEAEATGAHLAIVGALIAKLHNHGARFDPPQGFTRKHWDLEGLKGGMLDVPAEKAFEALDEEEIRVIEAAEQVTAAAMKRLGRGEQVYGLIHADLHLKSFLFHGDDPLVLDFDTCGYGYYIYDLAVVVWNLFDREDFAVLRKALLEGYRGVRSLSELEEQHLVHFIAGRLMTQTLAWAARRDDPGLAKQADAAIKRQTQLLEMLIRIYGE
jgi:Ser/Thr protein kinase RdoA (MazF antagonist)